MKQSQFVGSTVDSCLKFLIREVEKASSDTKPYFRTFLLGVERDSHMC